ncbi:MAG TPA: tRNA pseudouridine(55) synthase TruB [Bryobacteraceae bacterium]|nr:tRNA pseudouridine(55) synthase TruB [Bryobacteraceae bacterium]
MIQAPETLCGVFVIDKPAGWTSHDVVAKLRRIAKTKKVGHLGTLDPLATGVLPLLVGRATRLAQFFGRNDKRYQATIRFGHATDTYDAEGSPTSEPVEVSLDCQGIRDRLSAFVGRTSQIPPPVSAKKINGVPAYKLVRQNRTVDLAPVEIEIFSLELLRCQNNEIDIEVHSGPGTYIRSLAHDLGQQLGCGAFLQNLRRTASGAFDLSSARTLGDLIELSEAGRLQEALLPAGQLLPEFPAEIVDPVTVGFIRHGREFRLSPFRGQPDAPMVKAVTPEGDLVAIGEAKLPNVYKPILVL